jgi:hypothetical protein
MGEPLGALEAEIGSICPKPPPKLNQPLKQIFATIEQAFKNCVKSCD